MGCLSLSDYVLCCIQTRIYKKNCMNVALCLQSTVYTHFIYRYTIHFSPSTCVCLYYSFLFFSTHIIYRLQSTVYSLRFMWMWKVKRKKRGKVLFSWPVEIFSIVLLTWSLCYGMTCPLILNTLPLLYAAISSYSMGLMWMW